MSIAKKESSGVDAAPVETRSKNNQIPLKRQQLDSKSGTTTASVGGWRKIEIMNNIKKKLLAKYGGGADNHAETAIDNLLAELN